MPSTSSRESIRDVSFRLFAAQGYEATTVEEIVAAAGVARSTFFRLFGSKEAVVFPDHDEILSLVEDRLRSSTTQSPLDSVADAVKVVLAYYVAEGDRATERYRLTSTVPALRERELVSGARYQRLFRRYISSWGDGSEPSELQAEVMAAGVVAAHNRVLRQWLRGEVANPHAAVDAALSVVVDTFTDEPSRQAVVVVTAPGVSTDEVVRALAPLRASAQH